jgi:general secretion pathway protein A
MYEAFYGLKEKPFSILPDPDYLFFSKDHQDAFSMLEYAVTENTGFAVLTGEIGSGKTTLLNHLLRQIGPDCKVGLINNTHVNFSQLMKMICMEFELDVSGMDVVEMVDYFYQYLLKQYAARRKVILIIDEAQNLSVKVLDQIRMLSNYDAEKQCLVHIILMGQPELRRKLNQKQLEQFMQRVTMSHHLKRLEAEDIKQYVQHRLKVAGAPRLDIFDDGAIAAVARYSIGVPRLINTLCEIGLVYGFAEELPVIGKDIIEGIIEERDATGFYALGAAASEAEVTPANIASAAVFLDNKIKSLDSKIDEIKSALSATLRKPAPVQAPPPPAEPRIPPPLRTVQETATAKKVEPPPVVLPTVEAPEDDTEKVAQPKSFKFTRLFEKIGKEI